MVWPRRPISRPSSSPSTRTVIAASSSSISTVASSWRLATTRSTIACTRPAAVAGRSCVVPSSAIALAPALALAGRGRGRLDRLDLLGGRLVGRWEDPLDDVLLTQSPDVGRDPVDDQSRREADDERDDDQRQREHQDPLLAVGGRGHHHARAELGGDEEDDQGREHGARRGLRQVGDEQEAGASDVLLEARPAQQSVERDEDRDLKQQRDAGREWVDLVLLVEAHQLALEALAIVLVLLRDLLDLRLVGLQRAHRANLLYRERQDHDPRDERQQHDREPPADSDIVVEELQHRLGGVDQRLEDVRERQDYAAAFRLSEDGDSAGRNRARASSGS